MTKNIVIFGGSGNLAMLKLVYELFKLRNKDLNIILYGRSDLSKTYKQKLLEFHSDYTEDFLNQVSYVRGSYQDVSQLDNVCNADTILYFATPTHVYNTLLASTKLIKHKKIALEKPFGSNLKDFQKLKITDKCVFIDHYLTKPLSLVFPYLRKQNDVFDKMIRNVFIESIDVVFTETLLADGISNFDKNGTVKDVMQNHMIEMLAIVLSKGDETNGESLSKARSNVIKNLSIVPLSLVKGQYKNYAISDSKTETFAYFTLKFKDGEFKDIPCNFIAGKGLHKKESKVVLNINQAFAVEFMQIINLEVDILPKKISVSYSFLKDEGISIDIEAVGGTTKREIVSCSHIENMLERFFNGYSDYGYVFNNLVYNDNPALAMEYDVKAAWELFEPILNLDKELFFYEQNSKPSDILDSTK
ncbi:ZWF1 [Ecytonucleospora hepatopenaei]|uniref:Glucose-6-phosphate 1-dehydrogenase n=1 Tax=Ecytonucleospora hepatopenaei TaxID=646526 RepID=A0A1W0E5G8_9MICR|nr:ZWF1 [Ecytonucleospora hepatopenaei]